MINRQEEQKPLGIILFLVIKAHWKLMAILSAAAMITAAVFTSPFFVEPQYKAETIFYPPTSNTSTNLLNSDMRFGTETDINNEVQILHSTILRDSLVKKYKLFAHYKIDSAGQNRNYEINKTFSSNVKIDQSRYNSIVISVYDTDPALAADMANDMVKMADKVKSEIIKKNLKNAFSLVSNQLNEKIKDISVLSDSITVLRQRNYNRAISQENEHFQSKKKYVDELRNSIINIRNKEGVYDLDQQFNDMYKTWLKANAQYMVDSGMVAVMKKRYKPEDTALIRSEARLAGSKAVSQSLKEKLEKLNRSGKKYNDLMDNYNFEKGILGGLKSEYDVATNTFEKEFNNLHLETLKNKYTAEMQLYNNLKARYELALSNLTDQVPASYVISPAEVISKKVFPPRTIITLFAGIAVFMGCLAWFLLADYFRKALDDSTLQA